MTGEQIVLGPGQRLTVIEDSPEHLVLESRWSPSGSPPPWHWHPSQTEAFEVLEGVLIVELTGQRPSEHPAGQSFIVPPRTGHRMWNASAEPARARWTITPALRTREQMEHVARGRSRWRDLQLLVRFRREFRLGQHP